MPEGQGASDVGRGDRRRRLLWFPGFLYYLLDSLPPVWAVACPPLAAPQCVNRRPDLRDSRYFRQVEVLDDFRARPAVRGCLERRLKFRQIGDRLQHLVAGG